MEFLGALCRDRVTGFSGIATVKSNMLYHSVQCCIEPAVKEGEIKKPEWFDVNRLEMIDAKPEGIVVIPAESVSIKLGWRVQDEVSGFVGIATEVSTHLNGCSLISVSGKAKDGAEKGVNLAFSHSRLKKLDDGVLTKALEARSSQEGAKRPGCNRNAREMG